MTQVSSIMRQTPDLPYNQDGQDGKIRRVANVPIEDEGDSAAPVAPAPAVEPTPASESSPPSPSRSNTTHSDTACMVYSAAVEGLSAAKLFVGPSTTLFVDKDSADATNTDITTASVMGATVSRLGLTGLGSLQAELGPFQLGKKKIGPIKLGWNTFGRDAPCQKERHSLFAYQTSMVLGLVEQGTGFLVYGGVRQNLQAPNDPAATWSFTGTGWASSYYHEAGQIVVRHYGDLSARRDAGELGEADRPQAIAFENNMLGLEGVTLGLDLWGAYKFLGVVSGSGETAGFPALTPNRAVGSLANFGYPAVMAASSIAMESPQQGLQWGMLTASLVGPLVMVGLNPDASWNELPSWAKGDWVLGTGVNIIGAGLTLAHRGAPPDGFAPDYIKYAHGAIAARTSATLKPFASYTTSDGSEWLWGPQLWSPVTGDPALADQKAQAILLVANTTVNAASLGRMMVEYDDPLERLATAAALAVQLGIPKTAVDKQVFAFNAVGAVAGGVVGYISGKSAEKKKGVSLGSVTLKQPTVNATSEGVQVGIQGTF